MKQIMAPNEFSGNGGSLIARGIWRSKSGNLFCVQICYVQGSAKEWSLGFVKRAPVARGGQDAGVTQPRYHSLADPCMYFFLF